MKKLVVIVLLLSTLAAQSAYAWTNTGYRYSRTYDDYNFPFNRFDAPYQNRHFYPQQQLRFYNGPHYRYWDNYNRHYPRHHFRRCFHNRFR